MSSEGNPANIQCQLCTFDCTDNSNRTLFERCQLLMENTNELIILLSKNGRILEVNGAAVEKYGYDYDQLIGMPIHKLAASYDNSKSTCWAPECKGGLFESLQKCADGSTFPAEISVVRGEEEGETILLSIVRDTSRRTRYSNVHRVLHEVDQLILADQPVDQILRVICRRVVEIFGFQLAWIGTRQESGLLEPEAAAGPAVAPFRDITIRWDDSGFGQGSSGEAARTGEPQYGALTPDSQPRPWADFMIEYNLRSYASLPLIAEERVLGVFTMYSSEVEAFDSTMAQQLERFSQQVALSLVNARRQRQIKVQTEALEAAANAVIIADREGKVQWVNQAFTKLTGYSRDEIVGETPRILQSGMHERAFYSNLWGTILSGETWRGEVVNRCKDGSLCIEEQIITPVATRGAEISHFIAVKQDITERRKQERKLRHLATHEPLTGLPNRHALEERLEEACREAAAGHSGALLHLDLDDFRLVNDAAGYTIGDRLLEGVANLLKSSVRRGDFVARPGGDEFVVVLDDVDLAEAQTIARRLQQTVHSFQFELGSHHLDPTVSIGAVGIDGELEPQMLLSLADAAVQAAKAQGKRRIVFHHELDDVRLDVSRMCRLAGMVEEALERDGFVFHFQPIMSMKTGLTSCYEVLLRMPGKDGQLLFPGEFMPAASRYRLETGIDRWVITNVLKLLQEYPGLTLSLNISSPTLSDPRVLAFIEQELGKDRDLASRLFLEISENTIMADLEGLAEWMERINDLGSCFFLDDFGSGFSSLVYIRTLPLYGIKIDGSFVQNIAEDSTNRAMVEAMNMMGHTLGMEVIAEWVETREAAQVLQQIGVEYGQGFFLGRPVPGLPQDGVAVDLFGQVD